MASEKLESELELHARPGSMYNVDVESAGLADRIRCQNNGDSEYCEIEDGGRLANVRGGEFDKVDLDGLDEPYVTLSPQAEHYDTFVDSFQGYCGDVTVEPEEGWDEFDSSRRLVCVNTDVLG